jgi:tetratricopeptide (TPR) repeat protein
MIDLRQMFQYSVKFNTDSIYLWFLYSEFEMKIPLKIEILDQGIKEFLNDPQKNSKFISVLHLEKIRLFCLSNSLDKAIHEFEIINFKELKPEHQCNLFLFLFSLKLYKTFPVISNGMDLLKYIENPLLMKFNNDFDLTDDFKSSIERFDLISNCKLLCLNFIQYKLFQGKVEDALKLCQEFISKDSTLIEIWNQYLIILEEQGELEETHDVYLSVLTKFPKSTFLWFNYFNFSKRNDFPLDEIFSDFQSEFQWEGPMDSIEMDDLYFWLLLINYASFKKELNSQLFDQALRCSSNLGDQCKLMIEYLKVLEEYPNEFNTKFNDFLKLNLKQNLVSFPVIERLNIPILKNLIKIPKDFNKLNNFLDSFPNYKKFLFDEGNFEAIFKEIKETKSLELLKKSMIEFPNSTSLYSLFLNFFPTKPNFETTLDRFPFVSSFQMDVSI